jgi:hypothetical protein
VTSGCWQAETEAAPIRYVAELLDVDTDCDLLFALPTIHITPTSGAFHAASVGFVVVLLPWPAVWLWPTLAKSTA